MIYTGNQGAAHRASYGGVVGGAVYGEESSTKEAPSMQDSEDTQEDSQHQHMMLVSAVPTSGDQRRDLFESCKK